MLNFNTLTHKWEAYIFESGLKYGVEEEKRIRSLFKEKF